MRPIKFCAWNGKTLRPVKALEMFDWRGVWMHVADEDGGVQLMQFTGLTDKNGREIYEGDIFAEDYFSNVNPRDHSDNTYFDSKPRIKVVEWRENGYQLRRGKVIGNKFENPELLETA